MRRRVRILHNPRCSKSRATLALLENQDAEVEVVDYLAHPPTVDELDSILRLLGMQPRELMRQDEDAYRQLELGDPSLDRHQLITAMVAHPRLIQRPIVLADGKAALGRPPEAVLSILR